MTALSSLVTRAQNELNDLTNNTFASSMTGQTVTELTQYAIDGVADYSNYAFREVLDSSIITSANLRSYVVSALSPAPLIITRVEYVYTSTDIQKVPEVELWNGTMYLFNNDTPLFTNTAGKYFNIWYLSRHTIPSAGSATITVPTQDEELIVDYIKWKGLVKYSLDQRGINQDSANEFLNIATALERHYREGLRRVQTTYASYK